MLSILRRLFGKRETEMHTPRPGEAESLNPQPIPPGHSDQELNPIRPGDTESLNPQPIPPGHSDQEPGQ